MGVEITRAEATALLQATPFGTGERLDIRDGVIHAQIYGQDGNLEPFPMVDTKENRMFAEWLRMFDRFSGVRDA